MKGRHRVWLHKVKSTLIGDSLLSRDEWDIGGEVSVQYVEEVFRRTGRLLKMRAGGQEIGTTAEHPFWVVGKGWTEAFELRAGDQFVGHDGQRVAVETITDTGEVVEVYNLRVSNHHTYFVGCAEWGWNAWVHNACQEFRQAIEAAVSRRLEIGVVAGRGSSLSCRHDCTEALPE